MILFSILISTKGKTIIPSEIPAVSILLGIFNVTMKKPYTKSPIIMEGTDEIHCITSLIAILIFFELQ